MSRASIYRSLPPGDILGVLFDLGRLLSRYADIDSSLHAAAALLRDFSGADVVLAAFAERPGDEIVVRSAACREGITEPAGIGTTLRLGRSPGGTAIERGEQALLSSEGGPSWIETPVVSGDWVRGVLCARFPEPHGRGAAPDHGSTRTLSSPASAIAERDRLRALFAWAALLWEEHLALREALSAPAFSPESCSQAAPLDTRKGFSPGPPARAAARPDRPAQDRPLPDPGSSYSGMIGRSAPMLALYGLIDSVAATDATVLVTGESGTGKELVARAIHDRSSRSGGPFVAVNCAALPESVIESELFGHEKGSFTGAHAMRKGRFELANGGTLFLDEISELPQAVQAKLLRILQERSFERVGGSRTLRTDVRIITATNRNLESEVRESRFREDLYFRLNVFPIHVPPLRDRGADILLLADWFAERSAGGRGGRIVRISSPALDLFITYHWPGNVRELENCIERAAILSADGVIHAYNLPPSLQSAESTGTGPASTMDGAIARLEKEMLVEALKLERGNSAAAARRLGLTERRFRLGLEKYKIDWRKFRTKL